MTVPGEPETISEQERAALFAARKLCRAAPEIKVSQDVQAGVGCTTWNDRAP